MPRERAVDVAELGAPLHVGAAARRRSSLATVVFNVTESTGYLGVDNFVNLFELHIEKVIVVVTMTFVIIAGEIDLSVASVMAWSAACSPRCTSTTCRSRSPIVVALAAAAVAGLIQGWCVARLGLPSLVVTLAGLIGWRGAARVLVEDRSIGGFPRLVRPPRPGRARRPAAARAADLLRAVRRRLGRSSTAPRPGACST